MERVVVVGAGLSGATIARLFAESGMEVIVYDKRETIGGNAYDYLDGNDIRIQPYGPHIFHTNDKQVFDFLSLFTEWREYEHKVTAHIRKDKLVPVPFNLNSLFALYPDKRANALKELLINEFGENAKVPILTLKRHKNKEIKELGEYVYKNIFYIYTLKQWHMKPEHLGKEIIERVPVYLSNDDRYFTDKYQYMPTNGFTKMISNLLAHPKIKLKLKTQASSEISISDGKIYLANQPFEGLLIYTGCVDELFNYKYKPLAYRSLKLKIKTLPINSYQQTAVVNYTTSAKFTRITEFTKYTCDEKEYTVIMEEYSKPYKKGKNIPYFPIPTEKTKAHYQKYVEEAKAYKNLYLLGRLGGYKYINMDQAVRNAIDLYEKITGEEFDLSLINPNFIVK